MDGVDGIPSKRKVHEGTQLISDYIKVDAFIYATGFDHRKWLLERGISIVQMYNASICRRSFGGEKCCSVVGKVRMEEHGKQMYLLEAGLYNRDIVVSLYFSSRKRTVYAKSEVSPPEFEIDYLYHSTHYYILFFVPVSTQRFINYDPKVDMKVQVPIFTSNPHVTTACNLLEARIVEEHFPLRESKVLLKMIDALRTGKDEAMLWDTFPVKTTEVVETREGRTGAELYLGNMRNTKFLTSVCCIRKLLRETPDVMRRRLEISLTPYIKHWTQEVMEHLVSRAELLIQEGMAERDL